MTKMITQRLLLPLLLIVPAALFAAEDKIEQREIPRLILHDILTNRVCLFESKLYSPGAKVMIVGVEHECVNANALTFGGSDSKWNMRWVPVNSENHK